MSEKNLRPFEDDCKSFHVSCHIFSVKAYKLFPFRGPIRQFEVPTQESPHIHCLYIFKSELLLLFKKDEKTLTQGLLSLWLMCVQTTVPVPDN